jgi:hypothetical protein
VYVVWFNMLFGDARDRWDAGGVIDPRVRHFWDEQKVVGNWFSANVLHRQGTTWDFYAVYGPEATWDSEPPHALSQGGTIITRREQLQTAIAPLLSPGS